MAEKLTERADTSAAGRIGATRDFITATQAEMRKVAWPSRPELIKATRMIIVLSVILGITIGLLDFGLQKILVEGVARMAR